MQDFSLDDEEEEQGWVPEDTDGAGALADLLNKSKKKPTIPTRGISSYKEEPKPKPSIFKPFEKPKSSEKLASPAKAFPKSSSSESIYPLNNKDVIEKLVKQTSTLKCQSMLNSFSRNQVDPITAAQTVEQIISDSVALSTDSNYQINKTELSSLSSQLSSLVYKIERDPHELLTFYKLLVEFYEKEQSVLSHIGCILRWKVKESSSDFSSAATIKITEKLSDKQLGEFKSLFTKIASRYTTFTIDAFITKLQEYVEQKEKETSLSNIPKPMDRVKQDYSFEMDQLKRDHTRQMEELELKHKREVDNIKALAEAEAEIKSRQEMDDIKRQHRNALEDARVDQSREVDKVHREYKDKMTDMMRRLQDAESALVTSKQSYFSERERQQESMDHLSEQIRSLQASLNDKSQEMNIRKQEYDDRVDKLSRDLDRSQDTIRQLQNELDAKTREVYDVGKRLTGEMDDLKDSYEKRISDYKRQLQEFDTLQNELATIERDYSIKIQNAERQVQDIQQVLREERLRAQRAVDDAKESSASASDQLNRMTRLLQDAERDIDRYRRYSQEKDNEILELKKNIRQKEREREDSFLSQDSATSMKRLMEQKDMDIESCQSQVRSLLTDVSSLKRQIDLKDREIEDCKRDMERRAKLSRDDGLEEVDRMSLLLLDLKTEKVKLMEQLDNAQHNNSVLKAENSSLKNELERLRTMA